MRLYRLSFGHNELPKSWSFRIFNSLSNREYEPHQNQLGYIFYWTPIPVYLRCELCGPTGKGVALFYARGYHAEVDVGYLTFTSMEALPATQPNIAVEAL